MIHGHSGPGYAPAAECLFRTMGCTLAILRIDHYRHLLRAHGAEAAAALLSAIERRLADMVLPRTVLREDLREDEFAIFLPFASGAEVVAQQGARLLATAARPFFHDSDAIPFTASLGVAVPDRPGASLEDALHTARLALAEIGREGGIGVRFCTPENVTLSRRLARLRAELPAAIAGRQIVPYYQPVIDLRTGGITSLEVLARWRHPVDGMTGPDVFIPMAEAEQLCCALTQSLMEQAHDDSQAWPQCWRYAFNISPFELPQLVTIVQSHSARPSECRAPRSVELEVTETALIQDSALMKRLIDKLRPAGIDVALDDFGTGYANFRHLRDVPFTKLKLDKSFVTTMTQDRRAQECARAIIDMAHSLGMTATAEGVETADVAERLVSMGCDFAQGYYFARPLPASAVDGLAGRPAQEMFLLPGRECRNPCEAGGRAGGCGLRAA